MINRSLGVIIFSLIATGCTSGRLDKLERKISSVESGLIKNDKNIKSELKQLHMQTEHEIQNIHSEIQSIRSKTDKFTVRKNSGTLLFEPTSK